MTDKKKEKPFVFVRCMTFNHEAYIKDALNGFVMQQTTFPFVVAIINDASTDNTKSVINEFVENNCIYNPEIDLRIEEYGTVLDVTVKDNPYCIFHIVHLNENHYGKKSKLPYFAKYENAAKYVAMCEGDDYWTDPLKLQKQVDFMEANPYCSVSFHRCNHYFEEIGRLESDGLDFFGTNNQPTEITLPQFFKKWCTQPLTMMYLSEKYNPDICQQYKHFFDTHLIYHLLCVGKGYLLPFNGGCYRRHSNGISSGLKNDVQRAEFALTTIDELFALNRNVYVRNSWRDTMVWTWNVYKKARENKKLYRLVIKELQQFPVDMANVIWTQIQRQIKKKLREFLQTYYRILTRQLKRIRLRNKDFTILTNTCIGGVIYHELGLQFLSPTINLWMHDKDFYNFVNKLEYYLSLKLKFVDGVEKYPVAYLGDIMIHFNHYETKEHAERKWEERKKRINYNNLFIICSDRPCRGRDVTYDDMKSLENVTCCGKIVFSIRTYHDVPYIIHLPKDKDGDWVNQYMFDKTSILKRWKWEKVFDYVSWLNKGN